MSLTAVLQNDLLIHKLLGHLPFDAALSLDSTCRLARHRARQLYWPGVRQISVVFQIRTNCHRRVQAHWAEKKNADDEEDGADGDSDNEEVELCAVINGVELDGARATPWLASLGARLAAVGGSRLESLTLETDFFVRRDGQLGRHVTRALDAVVAYLADCPLTTDDLRLGGVFIAGPGLALVRRLREALRSVRLWGNSWVPPVADEAMADAVGALEHLERLEFDQLALTHKSRAALLDCRSPIRDVVIRDTDAVMRPLASGEVKWTNAVESLVYEQQSYAESEFCFEALPDILSAHFPALRRLTYARSFTCLSWQEDEEEDEYFIVWSRTIGTDLPRLWTKCPLLRLVELGQIDVASTRRIVDNLLFHSPEVDLDPTTPHHLGVFCASFQEVWTQLVGIERLTVRAEVLARIVSVFREIVNDTRRIAVTAPMEFQRHRFQFLNRIYYVRSEPLPFPVTLRFSSVHEPSRFVLLSLNKFYMPKPKSNEAVKIPCTF